MIALRIQYNHFVFYIKQLTGYSNPSDRTGRTRKTRKGFGTTDGSGNITPSLKLLISGEAHMGP